jgi:hypothetical protein
MPQTNFVKLLKENTTAFGLMHADLKNFMRELGWDNCLQYMFFHGRAQWGQSGDFREDAVYRLRESFVCPHTRTMGLPRVCNWCGHELPHVHKETWQEKNTRLSQYAEEVKKMAAKLCEEAMAALEERNKDE